MSTDFQKGGPNSGEPALKATEFGGFTWNPYMRTYVPVEGEPVDTSDVRRELASIRRATSDRLGDLAKQVMEGDLTNLAEFAIEFKDEMRSLYIATHVLARGGVDQMTQREWGQLGSALREQYKYANAFVRDIENGTIGMPIDQRISLYTESAWGAAGEFESVLRDREMLLGSMERRVLGDSKESCDDCIEAANMGWQPPGILPDIGDTECGIGCNCSFEFENIELDEASEAFGTHAQIGREGSGYPEPFELDLYPDLFDDKSLKGGPGSGNFGHAGRPGEVGGSGPGGGEKEEKEKEKRVR